MVRYTVLRLMVFFACLALLWLVGLREEDDVVLLVVGAALLSAVISFVGLRRFREDYSTQLAGRLERRSEQRRERAAGRPRDEDAEDAETSHDNSEYR
ncbi:MAG: DUF4229 domain-containing protein [Dermatophilaceae bacterium]